MQAITPLRFDEADFSPAALFPELDEAQLLQIIDPELATGIMNLHVFPVHEETTMPSVGGRGHAGCGAGKIAAETAIRFI